MPIGPSTQTAPDRAVRCRYRRRNDEMCTGVAADQTEDALIVLCPHHLARAVQLVNEHVEAARATGVAPLVRRRKAT